VPACGESVPEAVETTPEVLVHGDAVPVSKPGLPSSCAAVQVPPPPPPLVVIVQVKVVLPEAVPLVAVAVTE
jgi:hypothetical protein